MAYVYNILGFRTISEYTRIFRSTEKHKQNVKKKY